MLSQRHKRAVRQGALTSSICIYQVGNFEILNNKKNMRYNVSKEI